MKVYLKKLIMTLIFVVSCVLIACLSDIRVSAVEYEYKSGDISHVNEGVTVFSFKYDYISTFTEQSGFYNGNKIYDEGEELKETMFYSGKSITVNANHVDKFWAWSDDDDSVVIYRYSDKMQNFNSSLVLFDNKEGSYELKEEGLYKVSYTFEGSVQRSCYIYITTKMHKASVKGNPAYDKISAFSNFSFMLSLEDAYNLRNNKYYYAFGVDDTNLNFKEFNVFNSDDASDVKIIDNRSLEVKITEDDETLNSEKKRLYIKIVTNSEEKIIFTKGQYKLSKNLEGSVVLFDKEGKPTSDKRYYKQGDVISGELHFNSPVKFSNLMMSMDGKSFFEITDQNENAVTIVPFSYQVNVDEDISNAMILKTSGDPESRVIVNHENFNVVVEMVLGTEYFIDITKPNVSVGGDVVSESAKREYLIDLIVKDSSIGTIEYYISKCKISQGNECMDEFDESNKNMVKISEDEINSLLDSNMLKKEIKIDENLVGKINGKKLLLYVKAEDKAGNSSLYKKYGYMVDNVIVTENYEEIFIEEPVVEGENVIGKKLLVNVLPEYKVKKVEYYIEGMEDYESCSNEDDFECLDVEGYYFAAEVIVRITDEFDNEESYKTSFRYNHFVEGEKTVGDYKLNLYSDKVYDGEIATINNFMMSEDGKLSFNSELLSSIDKELGLQHIPNLTGLVKKLVYVNGEEIIVLVEGIEDSFDLPSNFAILEAINSTEKYNECSLKGGTCDFDVYLKYEYMTSKYKQNRIVKLKFIDNSLKFEFDDFNASEEVAVFGEFVEKQYKVFDSLNIEISQDLIVKSKEILFVNQKGETSKVDEIDTNKVGVYKVSEIARYNEVSSYPLKYEVKIIDSVAPSIKLKISEKMVVKKGDDIGDLLRFVAVHDQYDENPVVSYEWNQTFDKNKEGVYVISF